MYIKIHGEGKSKIIALCDSELIGKVLKEGEITLDLDNYSNFFKGQIVTRDEAKEALTNFASINIVGKKSVDCALELGLIVKNQIVNVDGHPHVQIYRIS